MCETTTSGDIKNLEKLFFQFFFIKFIGTEIILACIYIIYLINMMSAEYYKVIYIVLAKAILYSFIKLLIQIVCYVVLILFASVINLSYLKHKYFYFFFL